VLPVDRKAAGEGTHLGTNCGDMAKQTNISRI